MSTLPEPLPDTAEGEISARVRELDKRIAYSCARIAEHETAISELKAELARVERLKTEWYEVQKTLGLKAYRR